MAKQPNKQQGADWLRGVPMFSDLSQRDLAKLWSNMKLLHHDDGVQIAVEGHAGVGFHLIVAGTVEVTRRGLRVTLGPGKFFGEMSLIDDGPRTATVTASGDVTTASLTSWTFKSLMKSEPEVLWRMLVHLTGRLREEQNATANLTA